MSSDSSAAAIETTGLVKSFGEKRAVDGIDLTVPAGTVYGVLGPNGAGKTTFVKTLATLLRPDGGEARIFGRDVVREADEVRARIPLTGSVALSARVGGGSGSGAAEQASRLLAEPARAGITVDNLSLGRPSLDEVFLALTDDTAKSNRIDKGVMA